MFDFNISYNSDEEFYQSMFQFNLANRWFETQSRQYGALHLSTIPLLMPKNSLFHPSSAATQSYTIMDKEGNQIMLPFNIR